MVPFIDVMLVLLIIFMVSAPLITTGVVDLPSMGKAKQRPPSVIEVIVGTDEHIKIRIDKADPEPITIPDAGRARQRAAGRPRRRARRDRGRQGGALRERRQGDGHAAARRRPARRPGRQAGRMSKPRHEQHPRPAPRRPPAPARGVEHRRHDLDRRAPGADRRAVLGPALAQLGEVAEASAPSCGRPCPRPRRRRRSRRRRRRRPRRVVETPPPPPVETPKPPDIVTEQIKEEAAEAQADAAAAPAAQAGAAQARAAPPPPPPKLDAKALQKLHDENLKRMMGQMDAPATATGTAARNSGPSANYGGRVVARIKQQPDPDRLDAAAIRARSTSRSAARRRHDPEPAASPSPAASRPGTTPCCARSTAPASCRATPTARRRT